MTVAEMGDRVSQAEYVMWEAYFARVAQRKQLASKAAG